MTETESHEHARTDEALETLTRWGRDPGTDGGENIVFGVARQGAPSDEFLALGDCTPFTPSGSRGTLSGQPPASTGAPAACFVGFGGQAGPATVNQVPCTFSFDLNAGKVTLGGSFPNLPSSLDFTVEFVRKFDGSGGGREHALPFREDIRPRRIRDHRPAGRGFLNPGRTPGQPRRLPGQLRQPGRSVSPRAQDAPAPVQPGKDSADKISA
jgi:hypothetical protein